MLNSIKKWLSSFESDIGNELESYISSHYPKTSGDVERLTTEYMRNKQNFYYGAYDGKL